MKTVLDKPAPAESPAADSDSRKTQLAVTGMTCAACARRIEKQLNRAPGVRNAAVNFATEEAAVEYEPAVTGVPALIQTVEDAGYGAREQRAEVEDSQQAEHEAHYRELRLKLWLAAALSLPVLIISMSHGRVPWLNFAGVNWIQLALTTPVVLYCGSQFYRGAWAALKHRAADMNTLIAMGTGTAYVYSTAATLFPRFFAQ